MRQRILFVIGIYLFAGVLAFGLNSQAETAPDRATVPEDGVVPGDDAVAPPTREEEPAPRAPAPRVRAEPRAPERRAEELFPDRRAQAPRRQQTEQQRRERSNESVVLRCGAGSFEFLIFTPTRICKDTRSGKRYEVAVYGLGLGVSLEGTLIYINPNGGRVAGSYGGVGARYVPGIGGRAGVFKKGRSTLVYGGLDLGLSVGVHTQVVITEVGTRRAAPKTFHSPAWTKDFFNTMNMH